MEKEPKPMREITEDVRKRLEKVAENMVNAALQPDKLTGVSPDQSKREEMLAITEQELERMYREEGLDFFEPARVPFLEWDAEEKRWDLKWASEGGKNWETHHRFLTTRKE